MSGLERVRAGLDHASGYFRHAIARRLRMKVAPAVTFEIDQVFEQAARVERLLDTLAPPPPAESGEDTGDDSGDGPDDASRGGPDEE